MITFDSILQYNGTYDPSYAARILHELELYLTLNSEELDEVEKLVISKIQYNLFHSLDYHGNRVAPLSISWAAKKGHFKNFLYTGKLYRSVVSEGTGTNPRTVFINSERSRIAEKLQKGTGNMPARPFFGLSKNNVAEIYLLIKKLKKLN